MRLNVFWGKLETMRAIGLFLVGWLVMGTFAVATAQSQNGYLIGPKDLVKIQVFEIPTLSGDFRVETDGSIDFPLIGSVMVQGMSEHQLAVHLKSLLEEKYVQQASVTVEVREFRSRPISVIGAVAKPGPLELSGRWTLLEALTAAGGIVGNHGDVIHILRRSSLGLSDQLTIRVSDLFLKADPRANIPIDPGDVINVPLTMEVTVYCLGEVNSPGALNFRSNERMTLLSAIAKAGGMTDRASRSVVIKRKDSRGETEIEVDFKKILAGKVEDPALEPGDLVVVKESFF